MTDIAYPAPPPRRSDLLTRIPIGIIDAPLDSAGDPAYLSLGRGEPHLLAAGDWGKGKTTLLTGIAIECAYRGWEVLIADSSAGRQYGQVHDLPNLAAIAGSAEEAASLIGYVRAQMQEREGVVRVVDPEPMILILDDADVLCRQLDEQHSMTRGTSDPPALEKLTEILTRGSAVHIHVVAAAIGTAEIPASVRAGFGTRLQIGEYGDRREAREFWSESGLDSPDRPDPEMLAGLRRAQGNAVLGQPGNGCVPLTIYASPVNEVSAGGSCDLGAFTASRGVHPPLQLTDADAAGSSKETDRHQIWRDLAEPGRAIAQLLALVGSLLCTCFAVIYAISGLSSDVLNLAIAAGLLAAAEGWLSERPTSFAFRIYWPAPVRVGVTLMDALLSAGAAVAMGWALVQLSAVLSAGQLPVSGMSVLLALGSGALTHTSARAAGRRIPAPWKPLPPRAARAGARLQRPAQPAAGTAEERGTSPQAPK